MEKKIREIDQISKDLFSLCARLSNSHGPGAIHLELISSIRELLQTLSREIEHGKTFVEDEDDVKKRADQKLTMRRFADDLETHRILYRKAVRKSKQNLEQQYSLEAASRRQEIDDLDAAPSTNAATARDNTEGHHAAGRSRKKDEKASDQVLQASSDVTSELRKTHALMSEELSKSSLSREILAQSSATLSTLNEEYISFGAILNGSKRLLKELENADRADQYWIWGSFGFFCLVVSWIIYRRILSRPVNALLWTGSFIFSRANQRKIIASKMNVIINDDINHISSHAPIADSDSTKKRSLEALTETVLPDATQEDDQQTRLKRAKVHDQNIPVDDGLSSPPRRGSLKERSENDDIIHAEL